jgi:hypothetical protein
MNRDSDEEEETTTRPQILRFVLSTFERQNSGEGSSESKINYLINKDQVL